jgi:uncharacterized protein involved in cysteine biosynthesis
MIETRCHGRPDWLNWLDILIIIVSIVILIVFWTSGGSFSVYGRVITARTYPESCGLACCRS